MAIKRSQKVYSTFPLTRPPCIVRKNILSAWRDAFYSTHIAIGVDNKLTVVRASRVKLHALKGYCEQARTNFKVPHYLVGGVTSPGAITPRYPTLLVSLKIDSKARMVFMDVC